MILKISIHNLRTSGSSSSRTSRAAVTARAARPSLETQYNEHLNDVGDLGPSLNITVSTSKCHFASPDPVLLARLAFICCFFSSVEREGMRKR